MARMETAEAATFEAPARGFEVLWAGDQLAADVLAAHVLSERGTRVSFVSAAECAAQISARAPELLVLSGSATDNSMPSWARYASRSRTRCWPWP